MLFLSFCPHLGQKDYQNHLATTDILSLYSISQILTRKCLNRHAPASARDLVCKMRRTRARWRGACATAHIYICMYVYIYIYYIYVYIAASSNSKFVFENPTSLQGGWQVNAEMNIYVCIALVVNANLTVIRSTLFEPKRQVACYLAHTVQNTQKITSNLTPDSKLFGFGCI